MLGTYPFDVIKTRLSMLEADAKAQPRYKGIWDCATTTVKQEGFLALYKGFIPTIVGNTPYIAIQMSLYTSLQEGADKLLHSSSPSWSQSKAQAWLLANPNVYHGARDLCAGGAAGAIANLIIYPFGTGTERARQVEMEPALDRESYCETESPQH